MRYTREELERLRESPLVVRPPNLPAIEEYMGQSETDRRQNNRDKREAGNGDYNAKRPGADKQSRNNSNPVDIVLGPPKTSFASATSARNSRPLDLPDRPSFTRDPEAKERYSYRKSDGENDRTRENQRYNLRQRRFDSDQEIEGWNTVKPRKNSGAEGSEPFSGRMNGDMPPMPRRGSRDARDERPRGFDTFTRDKDMTRGITEESEGVGRRNGYTRGRNEPSWFKDKDDSTAPTETRKFNGDRFTDRSRGWREKDRDDKHNGDKNFDRSDRREDRPRGRWDRDDRRQEREPEWMDEPTTEKKRGHTAEDFQRWKESMNAGIMATPAEEPPAKSTPDVLSGQNSFFGFEKPKVASPLVTEPGRSPGPDKFLSVWSTPDVDELDAQLTAKKKEILPKISTAGKSSRFTSFFASPQEGPSRRQTETAQLASPLASQPASQPANQTPSSTSREPDAQANKEKEDFQRLLQKLQSQSIEPKMPTPPVNQAMQPKPPPQLPVNSQPPALDAFQQLRTPGNHESQRSVSHESQQAALQDLLGNRSTAVSQTSSRPDTMANELANRRKTAMSQGSSRPEDTNKNAAFLMGLMQNTRAAAPEPPRSDPLMMRGPPQAQHSVQQQLQLEAEREQYLRLRQRELAAQRQRPDPPPGFFDDAFLNRGLLPQQDPPRPRSQQPTQILQRPPPGLEQALPGWAPPQQQRDQPLPQPLPQRHPLHPPPGLPVGSNRGVPLPPIFPPGFNMPPGFGPPPPENLINGPRNLPPPPPGFMGPPPGFMAPPPLSGFPPGPEVLGYGPFDGRGGPPQPGPQPGNFRR